SGLGLAISQKIIEDHNGLLKIDSEPGAGTTVTISLPMRR
ncbi:MAG: PAS domain-containing sensor histidine kinase, partial [Gammaproteobacteria bacterium]|nr:PAS domain-containing sensor histidine kinase [Gammaproteobacteria bacterium]NIQ09029.1 PAS domain-containing sensor histidine kinase [Gammaproteobacteria bacterium]NIX17910.1 PAS domain-containing sensor histidine kinase [Gammaproteobacteria bacterium]NIY19043.1 PAS domain-containing sensor histidine kinase [Gammaproteobacteria bacterium]